MIPPVLVSSKSDEWPTDPVVYAKLSHRYGPFDLDVAATAENAKCPRYFTKEEDGLQQEWVGRCWMNPPYGRSAGNSSIDQWVRKAWESSRAGATVVCLLPAKTDTRWWQDYVLPYAAEIEYCRGRLRFGDKTHPAPFPSAVVVFRPQAEATCPRCGRLYVPRRRHSRFCSGACRQAEYRRRVTEQSVTLAKGMDDEAA